MSGTITSQNFNKALWPGVQSWFGLSYKETNQEWKPLFEIQKSRQRYEEVQNATGLGLVPIKPEGTPTVYDSMKQSYTTRHTHNAYGLGFIITHEMREDNLYVGLAKQLTMQLGRSARQTKEIVHANIFNRAFNASYAVGDGKALCATDHPIEGGTVANKPTVDLSLSEAAIEDAVIAIEAFTDNRGNRIMVQPTALVIPNTLQFTASRILKGWERPGTANRDINALNKMGIIPTIHTNRYFTDTNAWFIQTDCPDGLVHYLREAPSMKPPTDNDFDTGNLKYKFYERYVAGANDFRCIYGSSGV